MKTSSKRKFYLLLFTLYLLALFQITVWRSGQFEWLSGGTLNLTLFSEYGLLLKNHRYWLIVYLVVGNLIWFFPFGFLLPKIVVSWNKWYLIFLSGLALSLVIEMLQFLLGTGVSELDDLILNTAGTMIGFGFHCSLKPKVTIPSKRHIRCKSK